MKVDPKTTLPRLKPRTKAFADLLLSDPTMDQSEAWVRTHKTNNKHAARNPASKFKNSPNVQLYMKYHIDLAKRTAVQVMQTASKYETKDWQRLAADQAERIMDRELGKATSRVESKSISLNLNVEADPLLGKRFTDFLKKDSIKDL